jgi:hypothetical protein
MLLASLVYDALARWMERPALETRREELDRLMEQVAEESDG